jgi:hypothetical protein
VLFTIQLLFAAHYAGDHFTLDLLDDDEDASTEMSVVLRELHRARDSSIGA